MTLPHCPSPSYHCVSSLPPFPWQRRATHQPITGHILISHKRTTARIFSLPCHFLQPEPKTLPHNLNVHKLQDPSHILLFDAHHLRTNQTSCLPQLSTLRTSRLRPTIRRFVTSLASAERSPALTSRLRARPSLQLLSSRRRLPPRPPCS